MCVCVFVCALEVEEVCVRRRVGRWGRTREGFLE